MAILLNCVTLGMYQPCSDDETCTSSRCKILQTFDDIIFGFFALEMMIKMMAMGIVNTPNAYLTDTWNRLDFVIVVAGALEYCLDVGNMNLSAIRTVRVLRPLRAINRIPSMRILVMLLLDTLPMLGNVLLLCFFVFFIFGIIGVQLWAGLLRQRCFLVIPPNTSLPDSSISSFYQNDDGDKDYICSLEKDNGMHRCTNLPQYRYYHLLCTESALPNPHTNEPNDSSCVNWNQYYTNCRPGKHNPFQDAVSFDNVGMAWIAIFLVISLEGWSDIMYYVQDAHSFWSWIYFVLLIVIGSFFMINLCLVVIATQFSETKKREMERMRQERARCQSISSLASFSLNEQLNCYAAIIQYISHLTRKIQRNVSKWYLKHYGRKKHRHKSGNDSVLVKQQQLQRNNNLNKCCYCYKSVQIQQNNDNNDQYCPSVETTAVDVRKTMEKCNKNNNSNDINDESNLVPTINQPSDIAVDCQMDNADLYEINEHILKQSNKHKKSKRNKNCKKINHQLTSESMSTIHQIQRSYSKNSLLDKSIFENMTFKDCSGGRHYSAPSLYPQFYHSNHYNHKKLDSNSLILQKQNDSNRSSINKSVFLASFVSENETIPNELSDIERSKHKKNAIRYHKNRSRHKKMDDLYHYYHHQLNNQSTCSSVVSNRSNQYSRRASSMILSEYSCKKCCPDNCTQPLCNFWFKFRYILRIIVNHNYFQQAIFLAILLNTFSMGIEYHNQPESLSHAVEISNIIFTVIFCIEMILKLLASGFYEYIKSGFNVFDGCIVILSLLELLEEHGSGLSVLRTFRLLRILKLVRFMPALRRQLVIMLRTIDNVAVFFALLMLFIFIFSILGMNLFGCKFCDRNPIDNTLKCDRKNFDSLLWALVTVFQILTQEDWNVVLFNGMERASPYAALYFVALMTFGNYVLFNLLVAILVEGFSQEDEFKRSISGSTEKVEQVKQERLIYFYSRNDDLEREIQTLENPNLVENGLIRNSATTSNILSRNFNDIKTIPEICIGSTAKNHQQTVRIKDFNEISSGSLMPPLITHTAATPQGSPPSSIAEPFFPFQTIYPKLTETTEFNISELSKDQQQSMMVVYKDEHSSMLGVKPSKSVSHCLTLDVSTSLAKQSNNGRFCSLVSMKEVNIQNDSLSMANKSESKHFNQEKYFCKRSLFNNNKNINYMLPLRKELSYNQIRLSNDYQFRPGSLNDNNSAFNSSSTKKNHPSTKQRRKSFFFRQKSQGSLSGEKTIEDCSCPIYAKKNIVLRRKSVISEFGRSRSIASQEDMEENLETTTTPMSQHKQILTNLAEQEQENNSINNDNKRLSNLHYPSVSLSSNASDEERKNSLIHEIRVLSPRNSLKGVFYSSSVISIRNSNSNELYSEEILASKNKHTKNGPSSDFVAEKNNHFNNKIRKFCIYFKWTSWMTLREEYSLFLFSPTNRFRQYCIWIADHPYFDYVVLIFISLNCITLAMERPKIPPHSKEREFLNGANFVFTLVFGIEMLIKVIAKGLFYGENAYFHNGWNIMDGSLVGISLFDIFLSFFAQRSPRIFGILRVFRLLRSLRPLRVINRAPGLKLVVQTLLSSLRPIGNIVLICCTFFIIFGILGVQLFKGSFYYCDGPKAKHVRNKTECLSDPRNTWINRKYNFDNLGQALMSLFVLSSKDGWVNIMYTGLDAVGVDQQPIENYNEWRLLYFISFLLLVAFFVLNMFVGVVVENFHRCRQEQEQEEKAFRAMKRAQKMEKRRKKMREPPYFIGYGRFRLYIHRIVTGKYFDLVIALVIGLNVITMSLEHYMMPLELVYALKLFNFIFTSVFIVEAIMKAVALGITRYLKDKWNQLDVIIVLLSILGIILEEMESTLIPINPTIIRVMRVARIARVLKLLKMAKGIRQLLDTVMQALPQVGNLGLLFFLLFFIFAALGTELFGRLECDEEHPCQGLGEHAHFQNFGMAFLTLFRVATGDNWNGIMKDTLRDKCDASSDCLRNCCISPIIAPFYFVVFVLMAQFVLVNVVVAVLMKHLEESHKQLDEDEDYEIDLEIAREIEAERKALFEAIERRNREKDLKVRRPLMKMASLPSNFTFTFNNTTPLYEQNEFPEESLSMKMFKVKCSGEPWNAYTDDMSTICQNQKSKMLKKKDAHHCNRKQQILNVPLCQTTIKPSITCDSICLNGTGSGNSQGTKKMANENNNNSHRFCSNNSSHHNSQQTNKKLNGILKKSTSLKVKTNKTLLETIAKNSKLGKNSSKNKNDIFVNRMTEDREKISLMKLINSDRCTINNSENEDDELQHSKNDRSRSIKENNILHTIKTNSLNDNNSNYKTDKNFHLTLLKNSKFSQSGTDLSINQTPVTIKIDDCNTNDIKTKLTIDQKKAEDIIDQSTQSGLHLADLLTTTVTTTTASPSRIASNNLKHRKLSDFLDEESGPVSPGLLTAYPEFNSDAMTYDEDLNEVIDEDDKENMSLASIESWVSGEASD